MLWKSGRCAVSKAERLNVCGKNLGKDPVMILKNLVVCWIFTVNRQTPSFLGVFYTAACNRELPGILLKSPVDKVKDDTSHWRNDIHTQCSCAWCTRPKIKDAGDQKTPGSFFFLLYQPPSVCLVMRASQRCSFSIVLEGLTSTWSHLASVVSQGLAVASQLGLNTDLTVGSWIRQAVISNGISQDPFARLAVANSLLASVSKSSSDKEGSLMLLFMQTNS